MREHGVCRGCQRPWTCERVIHLYRGYAIYLNVASEGFPVGMYCPACLEEALNLQRREPREEVLRRFQCAPCAGSVGTDCLYDLVDRAHEILPEDVGAAPSRVSNMIGSGYFFRESFNTLDGSEEWHWQSDIYPVTGGTATTPRTPISTITLSPGELRCLCNKCANLRVTA